MSRPAIRVDNLGKRYKIGLREQAKQTFREALTGLMSAPLRRLRGLLEHADGDNTIWALRGVSFDVQPGEVVGIIGRNGAGKSTLLKILSRITEPTEGTARIRGRVGSLLEVGTGFHQELTGRENIYLNGSILGMRKAEIYRRFDDIVDFSGVEKFLDTPVKRYSSGMRVRLAFAVAANLEPEILLVDEVLAVGDHEFQRRCLRKMRSVATGAGRTVLFVSHNMEAIVSLCSSVFLLEQGRATGPLQPDDAVGRYLTTSTSTGSSLDLLERPRMQYTDGLPMIAGLEIMGNDRPTATIRVGDPLKLSIALTNVGDIIGLQLGIIMCNERHQRVAAFHTKYQANLEVPHADKLRIDCSMPSLPLVPGRYAFDLFLEDAHQMFEHFERAGEFTVAFTDLFGTGKMPNENQSCVVLPCDWKVTQ